MGTKTSEFVGVSVPNALFKALEEAVKCGTFKTKSELVRTSLREKLEQMGYLPKPNGAVS